MLTCNICSWAQTNVVRLLVPMKRRTMEVEGNERTFLTLVGKAWLHAEIYRPSVLRTRHWLYCVCITSEFHVCHCVSEIISFCLRWPNITACVLKVSLPNSEDLAFITFTCVHFFLNFGSFNTVVALAPPPFLINCCVIHICVFNLHLICRRYIVSSELEYILGKATFGTLYL